MVPVGQARPDEGVPPLMGAPEYVKLTREEALGKLGDVESKRDADKTVEDEDPRQKDLDLLTVESMEKGPVQGGDETIDSERDKVHKSQDDVLVLVHLVEEHGSSHDEGNHGGHVDGASGGVAPERIVDACVDKEFKTLLSIINYRSYHTGRMP